MIPLTGATGKVERPLVERLVDDGHPDAVLDGWESFVAHPEPVTTTVADVTGTDPRTFATWARDRAHLFR
jgi:predicted ThiF/HesA family dinucleotide-utilizing enzyme